MYRKQKETFITIPHIDKYYQQQPLQDLTRLKQKIFALLKKLPQKWYINQACANLGLMQNDVTLLPKFIQKRIQKETCQSYLSIFYNKLKNIAKQIDKIKKIKQTTILSIKKSEKQHHFYNKPENTHKQFKTNQQHIKQQQNITNYQYKQAIIQEINYRNKSEQFKSYEKRDQLIDIALKKKIKKTFIYNKRVKQIYQKQKDKESQANDNIQKDRSYSPIYGPRGSVKINQNQSVKVNIVNGCHKKDNKNNKVFLGDDIKTNKFIISSKNCQSHKSIGTRTQIHLDYPIDSKLSPTSKKIALSSHENKILPDNSFKLEQNRRSLCRINNKKQQQSKQRRQAQQKEFISNKIENFIKKSQKISILTAQKLQNSIKPKTRHQLREINKNNSEQRQLEIFHKIQRKNDLKYHFLEDRIQRIRQNTALQQIRRQNYEQKRKIILENNQQDNITRQTLWTVHKYRQKKRTEQKIQKAIKLKYQNNYSKLQFFKKVNQLRNIPLDELNRLLKTFSLQKQKQF